VRIKLGREEFGQGPIRRSFCFGGLYQILSWVLKKRKEWPDSEDGKKPFISPYQVGGKKNDCTSWNVIEKEGERGKKGNQRIRGKYS